MIAASGRALWVSVVSVITAATSAMADASTGSARSSSVRDIRILHHSRPPDVVLLPDRIRAQAAPHAPRFPMTRFPMTLPRGQVGLPAQRSMGAVRREAERATLSHGGRFSVTLSVRNRDRRVDRTRSRSLAELGVVLAISIALFLLSAGTNAYDRLQRWGSFEDHPREGDLLLALPFALLLMGLYAWRRYHEARDHAALLAAAERALERANQEYRSLFDHHPHGVFALDAQRKYRRMNAAAEKLGGYAAEEVLGHTFPVLEAPGGLDDLLVGFHRALAGDAAHIQTSVIRKDGAARDVDLQILPIAVEGETVGVYVIAGDVTDDNRLRADLQRAVAEAQEANEAKTLLLANISHELRTPLTSMLAASEMFDDSLSEQQRTNLITIIERNGQTLLRLVDDLLDLTRLETGQLVIDTAAFDLREVVNQAVSIATPKAQDKCLTLEVEMDESLPNAVLGDPIRVGQVLTNLLGNAVKFTDKGGIELHVRYESHSKPQRALFAVRDTGVGITLADQERVFGHFVQADPTSTRRFGGAGLGLTITRQLIEVMGGDIRLHSEVGIGTTVTVRLPFRAPRARNPSATNPPVEDPLA